MFPKLAPDAAVLVGAASYCSRFRITTGEVMMRALLILAVALLLAGCNGDRIKNSMNAPRAQPQAGLPTQMLGPPSAPAEQPAEERRKKAIRTASTSVPPNARGEMVKGN